MSPNKMFGLRLSIKGESPMEHPDITKMNKDGYLDDLDNHEYCEGCETYLAPNTIAVSLNDHIYCSESCLSEDFSEDPSKFGAHNVRI